MDKSTKKIFVTVWLIRTQKIFCQSLRWWQGGSKNHLNQKCRKFHEMDKSTKKNFFTVWPIWTQKIFLSKCEVMVGGGVSGTRPPTITTTLNINLTFWTQKMFLSKFEVVVVGGGQKSHLNQKCRKFHEMDKSTKFIFTVWQIWTCQSLRWWLGDHI